MDACIVGSYLECDNEFYAKDDKQAYFIKTICDEVKIIKTKSTGDFQFKVVNGRGYAFDNQYRYYMGKRSKL